jgi:hypothetical protein
MGDDELRAKFVANALAMAVASPSWRVRIDEIVSATLALEQVSDINHLIRTLAPEQARVRLGILGA